jgi:hypothetical protein
MAAGVAVVSGTLSSHLVQDGRFYIRIAQSLARSADFVLPGSPWPNQPELERLPLWPAILAVPSWLLPNASGFGVLRGTAILVHAIDAVLILMLAYRLSADPLSSLLAGIFFALYPSELAAVSAGDSEPSFFLTVTAGLLLLGKPGRLQEAGAVLVGLGALARSNLTALPFFLVPLIFWKAPQCRPHWKRTVLLTVLFFLPVSAWVVRNFLVSGAFPLVEALEGQTLWGSNNPVVADNLSDWGYWVFPDQIPGEIPKMTLAKQLPEAEVDRYYMRKALAYMRAHWASYPRLILGKLIRGFVPIPWVPSIATSIAGLARLTLYAAFLGAVFRRVPGYSRRDDLFGLWLVAMLGVTLTTTVVFYGSFRLTLPLEVYLIPWAAFGVSRWWKRHGVRFGVDATDTLLRSSR